MLWFLRVPVGSAKSGERTYNRDVEETESDLGKQNSQGHFSAASF
jgi:hypothetical protein